MWHGNLLYGLVWQLVKGQGSIVPRWKRKTSGRWADRSVGLIDERALYYNMHACLQEKDWKEEKKNREWEKEQPNLFLIYRANAMRRNKAVSRAGLQQYCGSEVKHTGWFVRPRFWAVFIGTGPCLHFCLWYENSFRCMVYPLHR